MAYDSENFIVSQSLPCAETGPNRPSSPLAPRLLDRDPKSLTEPRERLEYLRDFLRARVKPKQFDMWGIPDPHDTGTGKCGSPACIAGWALALMGDDYLCIIEVGPKMFGLTPSASMDLFGEITPVKARATPTQAANVLDHLIRTGEVRWDLA